MAKKRITLKMIRKLSFILIILLLFISAYIGSQPLLATSNEHSAKTSQKSLVAIVSNDPKSVHNETSTMLVEFYGIVYILPYRVASCQVGNMPCGDHWARNYGDRIYFYVHTDLSKYRQYIDEDFAMISHYYDTVVLIIPADDVDQFKKNLAIVNDIAKEYNLKIIWGIFPKWKYGPEYTYLDVGSAQYNLVMSVMQYLATLSQTYKIGVWYGWSDRCRYSDIENFYNLLSDNLKRLYALWLDEPYVKTLYNDLVSHNVEYFVITELYSYNSLSTFTDKLRNQVVVTGYSGAQNLSQWFYEVCRKVREINCCPALILWIFYDKGDGSKEAYAAYFPSEGLGDVKECIYCYTKTLTATVLSTVISVYIATTKIPTTVTVEKTSITTVKETITLTEPTTIIPTATVGEREGGLTSTMIGVVAVLIALVTIAITLLIRRR